MISVEGHKNLKRDEETGAIINVDSTEYNRHVANKKNRKTQKEEIDNIKNDISEIKTILMQILENKIV
jgi:hypothetical protein|tara:strand:+ start:310 stop:513 length:204 start_codon:yes stop_codon:yes gene_type:complete